MRRYFTRVSIQFSCLLNALLGGSLNQTLSATQYQRRCNSQWNVVPIIDAVFWWEPNHCREAWSKWRIIHEAINHYEDIGVHPLRRERPYRTGNVPPDGL